MTHREKAAKRASRYCPLRLAPTRDESSLPDIFFHFFLLQPTTPRAWITSRECPQAWLRLHSSRSLGVSALNLFPPRVPQESNHNHDPLQVHSRLRPPPRVPLSEIEASLDARILQGQALPLPIRSMRQGRLFQFPSVYQVHLLTVCLESCQHAIAIRC